MHAGYKMGGLQRRGALCKWTQQELVGNGVKGGFLCGFQCTSQALILGTGPVPRARFCALVVAFIVCAP